MSGTRLFIISATSKEGARSATRISAASAMVLADNWAQEGSQNVQVTNGEGEAFSREGFRSTLWLTTKSRRSNMRL